MIITDYVDGPYEGVSQTPPQVRLAGACEAMDDCLPAIPNGLQKRPPFTWVKQLTSNALADKNAFVMDIPRGDPSKDATLIISKESGSLVARLFKTSDMSAIALTVTSAAQTYLNINAPTPGSDLRACAIEDVTFITNRTVTVDYGSSTAAARNHEAILWVKDAQYGRHFNVQVTPSGGGTTTIDFKTSQGSDSNSTPSLDTSAIAKALYDGTNPAPTTSAVVTGTPLNTLGWVTLDGPTLYFSNATDFTIDAADGQGNTAMVALKGSVQAFSDLPKIAHDGFTVKVSAELAGGVSDYWVKFVADNSTTSGHWKECIAPGASLGLDPTTMPIVLTAVDGGTWTLDTGPWKGRQVGDSTLSPDPPFLGDQITDVKWWRGRLQLVANGSAILSSSADPYLFYASTLTVNEDSDAVDFLSPAERKTNFKAAVTFDSRNLLFANRVQAIISSSGAISGSSARIDLLGDTDFTDQIVPQSSNHKVYYAALRSKSAVIYELSIDRISGVALTDDKTKAVPTYIPNTINRASTDKLDYLTLYGTSAASQFFLHIYRYSDFQQVQNSWSRWNLPAGWTLAGYYFKATILYALLVSSTSNFHWVTLDVAPGQIDDGANATLLTYLDLRAKDTACSSITYSAGTGNTTCTLPIPVTAGIVAACRTPAGTHPEGYLPAIVSHTTTQVVLQGDWRNVPLWFGYTFNSKVVQSKWYKRGQDERPEHAGRLSLKKMRLDLANFGNLVATVSIAGRADRVSTFEGYWMNDPETVLDAPPGKKTVTLPVSIGGDAEETAVTLSNSTHLGFKLLGIEWQADWNPSARRIS